MNRRRPLQNRVTPFGDIVATGGRGLFMGNRGVLHDACRRVVRFSQGRRWIVCRLEFRGRRRRVMTPGAYTELFFLDEAAAFGAGHRPCAECRHADYARFRAAWAAGHRGVMPSAEAMDVTLHAERLVAPRTRRTHRARAGALPDGVCLDLEGAAWLLWQGAVHRWSAARYVARRRPPRGVVTVLTPPSTVAAIAAGYRPHVHPSAGGTPLGDETG
ncbi:MAG TPA: hypothetical protein VMR23_08280 [Candidatus Limnocylindria bacterium]|nr:hypothetical protein [Candidatus Limnocylindria bacterium]